MTDHPMTDNLRAYFNRDPVVEVVRRWVRERNRASSAWLHFGLSLLFCVVAFVAGAVALYRGSLWIFLCGVLVFVGMHAAAALVPANADALLLGSRMFVPDALLVVLVEASEIDSAAKARIAERAREGEVSFRFLYELCELRARERAEVERLQRPGVMALTQLLTTRRPSPLEASGNASADEHADKG